MQLTLTEIGDLKLTRTAGPQKIGCLIG
jgi:hypothetical protein